MAQSIRLAYPVRLDTQDRGAILVSFPDIPEALTEGTTERATLAEAEDCLIAALGGYINDRRDIPRPSPGRGRPLVTLQALTAAKIALYRAMRARGGSATLPWPNNSGRRKEQFGVCSISTTGRISVRSKQRSRHSGNGWSS